jgi:tRNA pseudouridine55 synthase
LVGYDWPIAIVEVTCEKGFYVRSLARDLGKALGTGGHCASIRRTSVGPFTIDEATDPDQLEDPLPIDAVLPLPEALARLEP